MRTLFLLLLALAISSPGYSDLDAISGKVESPTGGAISEAELRLVVDGRVVACTETSDASGCISMRVPLGRDRKVWARASGYAAGFCAVSGTSATVRLFTERVLEGTVVRANLGTAVVGARVEARLRPGRMLSHPPEIADCPFAATVWSDAAGRFRLPGLYAVEDYQLIVSATGCAMAFLPVPRENGQLLKVVLSGQGTLDGVVVVKSTGKVVAGATVEINRERWGVTSMNTDATGAFTIAGLGNEYLRLSAQAEGLFFAEAEPVSARAMAGRRVEGPTLYVEPGYAAIVRALDAKTRRPIAGTLVWQGAMRNASPEAVRVDGYRLPMQPRRARRWGVVGAAGYQWQEARIQAPTDGTQLAHVDVWLKPELQLHVNVRDTAGRPVPGATVALSMPSELRNLQLSAETLTGATGCAGLRVCMPEGTVRVEKQGCGGTWVRYRGATEEQTLDVVLARAATLSGAVRLAAGGVPSAATVFIAARPTSGLPFDRRDQVRVQPDGRWRQEGALANARLRVRVEAEDAFAPEAPEIELAEGEDKVLPEFVLLPLLSISGRVLETGSEKPVPGVRVAVPVRYTSRGRETRECTSDGSGAFTLTNLLPSSYQLLLTWPEDAPSPDHALPPDNQYVQLRDQSRSNLIIHALPGVLVEGVVVDGYSRAPIKGAGVSANVPEEARELEPSLYHLQGESDDLGRFRMVLPLAWTPVVLDAAKGNQYLPAKTQPIALVEGRPVHGVEIALERGCFISGSVVNATGEPAPSTYVGFRPARARPTDRESFSPSYAHTGEDGTFKSPALRDGEWELVAGERAMPFSMGQYNPPPEQLVKVSVSPGRDAEGVVLTQNEAAAAAAALAGVVLDHAGKPVQNAHVSAQCVLPRDVGEGSDRYRGMRGDANTDAAGKFKLSRLREGEYKVTVEARDPRRDPSSYRESSTAQVFEGITVPREKLELRLDPPTRAAGRVIDPGGKQLGGCTLVVLGDSDSRPPGVVELGQPDGAFDVLLPGPGPQQLLAVCTDGRSGRSAKFTAEAGKTTDGVEIQLAAPAELVVHARVNKDAAGGGAEVEVRQTDRWSWFVRRETGRQTLDEKGEARFTGLPAGSYDVNLSVSTRRFPSKSVALDAGQSRVVEFLTEPTGIVEGHVLDRRQRPVEGAWIRLDNNGRSLRTDGQGGYRFDDAPVGQVWLALKRPRPDGGFGREERKGAMVAEGKTVQVDWSETGGRIHGHVTQAGRAVEGAVVRFNDNRAGESVQERVVTDAKGAFEFTGAAGDVSIFVALVDRTGTYPRENTVVTKWLHPKENEDVEVEIALPTGRISGVVVMQDGSHFAYPVEITLSRDGHGSMNCSHTRGGREARFSFDALEAGAYQLVAQTQGSAPAKAEVALEADEEKRNVRLVVTPGGSITGTVHGPREARRASFRLSDERSSHTDVEIPGRYALRGVLPGSYQMAVEGEGFGLQVVPVEVAEDKPTECNIDLKPPVRLEIAVSVPASATAQKALQNGRLYVLGRVKATGLERFGAGYARFQPSARKDVLTGDLGSLPYHFTVSCEDCKPAEFDLDLSGQAPGSSVQHQVELEGR